MPSYGEVEAVVSVLWHTYAIRCFYEDAALHVDAMRWKDNAGPFPSLFRDFSKERWTKIVGEDDPTVRGRRISRFSMTEQRERFEVAYREPVAFALELADRVRAAVTAAVKKSGLSEDDDDYNEYEYEAGKKAWGEIASDPYVRKRLAEIASQWCNMCTERVIG